MARVLVSVLGFALLLSLFFGGCARQGQVGRNLSGSLMTVKGSDTMVHMVSNWAEQYMQRYPGTQIAVTGGGSGTGIAALLNGTADIAAVSRPMKDKELAQANRNGITPQEYSVANDGIVLVVHPKNPVGALTMAQLKKLYTGKITNWQEIGGSDTPVILFSRESSSGTYGFFQEHVLEGSDYDPKARLMPATSSIVEAVSSDQGGIGYVGLGYAENAGHKIKMLAIKSSENTLAVKPTMDTILSGEYPISRALHLYTAKSHSAAVDQFLDYVLSQEGQEIVKTSGYIPVQLNGKAL